MYIVSIILLHSLIYSTFGAPRIIFPENRNIPTGSNLRIRCVGVYSIDWKTPQTDRGKMVNSIHKNESLYESIFEIVQTIYTDTGEYTCSYERNFELEKNCINGNITKDRCEEYDDKTSSIYIFVNDPKFVFLPISGVIYLIENERDLIPCRVTFSHLNVSLWRKKTYVPMDTDISYDPTKGFTVNRLTDFFSGLFSCQVEFRNEMHEISFVLRYESTRSHSETGSRLLEVPIGSSVNLICYYSNYFPADWKLPKEGFSSKIEFSGSSGIAMTRTGQIQGGSKTLHIGEVFYNNTGYYICSNDRKNYDLDEVKNSVTYLFVNDPNNLFAPTENVQPVYTCIRNIIPCFPTFSTLNITLWLGSEQLSIGDGIMFENTRGFILDYPTLYKNETFTCQAEYGNKSQAIDIHILSLEVVTDLKIIATKNSPEKSEEFSLICSGCSYHYKEIKWMWRRFGEKEEYLISDNAELGINVLSNTSSSHTKIKILNFDSLSLNNSGVYICVGVVRKKNASNGRSQFYLRIKDRETPIIKFIYTNMNGKKIRISPGDELGLICEVEGFPQPNVTWYKDGKIYDIETSRQKYINLFHPWYDYSNRIVYSSVYNDSGFYQCIAENGGEILQRNLTVDIIKRNTLRKILPPKINKESYVDIKSGSMLKIECEGEEDLEWIWPERRISHFSSHVFSCRRYMAEEGKHFLSLEITSVSKENAGYYICCYIGRDCNVPQNKASTYIFINENFPNVMIPAHIPPVYHCILNAILCLPTNLDVNIELWRNSEIVSLDSGISFDKTRGFILNNASVSSNNNYTCKIKNSNSIQTSVKTFDVTPDILLYATDENPIEQDDVSLVCNACNFHYSDIKWLWRGKDDEEEREITNDNGMGVRILNNSTIHSIESHLQFDNISLINSGIYKCLAYSKLHSFINQRKQIEIIVRDIEKATILQTNFNGTLEILFGYPKELFCDVMGIPAPIITWYKDEEVILESEEVKVNKGNITINRFSEKYAGNYKCVAENRGGTDFASIILKIKTETIAFDALKISVIIVPIILLLTFAVGFVILKRRFLKKRDEQWMDIFTEMLVVRENPTPLNPNIPLQEQTESLPYDPKWEFPIDRINIGKILGMGAYGKVVEAEAIGIESGRDVSTVAVKMLKERADVLQFKSLLAELKILIHIGSHINIVNLLGAVTKNVSKGELMVVMEYCCFGNIRQYLIKRQKQFINQLEPETDTVDPSICSIEDSIKMKKIDSAMAHYKNVLSSTNVESIDSGIGTFSKDSMAIEETSNNVESFSNVSSDTEVKNVFSEEESFKTSLMEDEFVSTWDLLTFAYQTACGMEYLASRKLVHRDLAARNVLLTENNVIKICDFGLTKNPYDYAEALKKSNDPLPIRWLAIESLRDQVFSSKSDVWSFGIFLWELFSLGANPYPGIEVNVEFYTMLKNGYRMEKPDYAPTNIYEIMLNCWNNDPEQRPSFAELTEMLKNSLQSSVNKYYMQLDLSVLNEEDDESNPTLHPITETNENEFVHL